MNQVHPDQEDTMGVTGETGDKALEEKTEKEDRGVWTDKKEIKVNGASEGCAEFLGLAVKGVTGETEGKWA